MPPYRLRELSTKHEQSLVQERTRFEAERAQLQRQLQALTGALPPQNPEIDQVKSQFKTVFPELDEIGSQAAAIKELLALKDDLRAAMQHQWASHNRNAMDRLFKNAETTYGNPMNDEAKRALGEAFVGYLQSHPDEYEQYQQDPSVVDKFWTQFTDRFISPIQRSQVVAQANRIPQNLPQDNATGALPVSTPAKFGSQDDRLAAALNVYKAKTTQGF